MIRLVSLSVTGGGIGFFIGCVEELAKQAWIVRLVGKNEGRTIDLYTTPMTIGRSEFVDVPVFTDPDVSEMHAEIDVQGKVYFVRDLGSAFGTFVNGSKVTREFLQDGDTVTVGKTRFLFRDKATARSSSSGSALQGAEVRIPTSQHICQFCGAVKDASGNCDCTIAGGAPGQPAPGSRSTVLQSDVGSPVSVQPSASGSGVPQQSAVAGVRLTAVAGPYAGKVFPLKSGETCIGRDSSRDIGLPADSTISRTHARIAQEVTSYIIYDAGSTNGTFVNGARVQRKELQPNDLIQIGNSSFRFDA